MRKALALAALASALSCRAQSMPQGQPAPAEATGPTASLVDAERQGPAVLLEGRKDTSVLAITLRAKPTAPVVVPITVAPEGQVELSAARVEFDPDTWDQPRTVTVAARVDGVADGDAEVTITCGPVTSDDARFAGTSAAPIPLTIADGDEAGLVMTVRDDVVDETAGRTTGTLMLRSRPTEAVVVSLASALAEVATVEPSTITFRPEAWNEPGSFVVTALENQRSDGPRRVGLSARVTSTGDRAYRTALAARAHVTVLDDDTAGLRLRSTDPVRVYEGTGARAGLVEVALTSEPTAPVRVAALADGEPFTFTPAVVELTPSDWRTPKAIRIEAKKDAFATGTTLRGLTLAAASDDPAYAYRTMPFLVQRIDTDVAGLVVVPGGAPRTNERAGSAPYVFRVSLATRPRTTGVVRVPVTSTNTAEGIVTPTELVFDDIHWDSPQTVEVRGVADRTPDGDVPYAVMLGPCRSSDPGYDGLVGPSIALVNVDEDRPTLLVDGGARAVTSEKGRTTRLHVSLSQAPGKPVTVPVRVSDAREGAVEPSLVTLTDATWNVGALVVVRGVADGVVDGDKTFNVSWGPSESDDPALRGLVAPDVVVVNLDDDEP